MAEHTSEAMEVFRWIASGENVGMSSKAMACHLIGESTDYPDDYPHDPADLWRCLLLLRRIPSLKARLNEVTRLSIEWSRLIAHWEELEGMLKLELGDDLVFTGTKRAPKTYGLMQSILYPHGR